MTARSDCGAWRSTSGAPGRPASRALPDFCAAVSAEEVEIAGARRDFGAALALRGLFARFLGISRFLDGGGVRVRDFHDEFAQVRVVENRDGEAGGQFLVG